MLSRRNLRVKVMQVLFAIEHGNPLTPEQALQQLEKSIEKSYQLLFFNFALLVRIADYIRKEYDIKTSKLLPTEEDRKFSTRLCLNPFILAFRMNKNVASRLKLAQSDEDETLVKDLFRKLMEEDEYKLYGSDTQNSYDERKIIGFIFKNVIWKSPSYLQYIEDNFPECVSELGKINFAVTELVEKISAENPGSEMEFPESRAEEEFAKELLQKTIADNDRFTALIQPKLKNWDLDRIARLDMVLMKMALCELLCFEQIPVKVSINEYIEISKIYSTPRSKDFINGILDSIMHELKEKSEIRKTGRGLVE